MSTEITEVLEYYIKHQNTDGILRRENLIQMRSDEIPCH